MSDALRSIRTTSEPHRLAGPLSRRVREMHRKFTQLQFSGGGMTREDIDRIAADLKAMAEEAAQLERPAPRLVPVTNPAVPPAFDLLGQAEATIGRVRRDLVDLIRCDVLDPKAVIQAQLADATAQIMRAQDMIRENTGELAS